MQKRRGRSQEAEHHTAQRTKIKAPRHCGVMTEPLRKEDERLEERLGYTFQRWAFLDRALTHSSAVPELTQERTREADADALPEDNERLEFLGDAVLDL